MRILIISDIHANIVSVESLKENFDYMVCLGDVVDYGPDPKGCIDFVRNNCFKLVRGNHDHALAFGVDCGCSYDFKHLSVSTREYHRSILDEDDINFLRKTALTDTFEMGGARFFLAHASPSGDLYRYLKPQTDLSIWMDETGNIDADFILLGHTHLPMIIEIGKKTIINPGSIGQPRDGCPDASYALWDDGRVFLKRIAYDIERTIKLLSSTPLPPKTIEELSSILRRGGKL